MLSPPLEDGRDPGFAARFLDALVTQGSLPPSARDRALRAHRESGQRIDVVLTELGLMAAGDLLGELARHLGRPMVVPSDLPPAPVLGEHIPADFVRRARILPVEDTGEVLIVASADPFDDEALQVLGYFAGRRIEARLASAAVLDAAIERLYGSTDPAPEAAPGGNDYYVSDDDLQRLRDIGSEAPVVRFVQTVLTSAAQQRASDVHIEPLVDSVRVRFRIDGIMAEADRVSRDLQAGIAARIKILARLNVAERRLPQDGRIKFAVAGRDIDVRVSFAPTAHGESIVLRLLDQFETKPTFRSLGFDAATEALLERMLAVPHGLVLVTGPTGSGKTTSLYAALERLNSVARKVFTVEDPIEYEVQGVNQMQVQPALGLDFVNCLRAILRQDPDIVMIGEIRDSETARTGVRAALTGHLVLSTLHTNDAPATITRLLDMGVEDYLLAATLTGIVAQRLVRKLCAACRDPYMAENDHVAALLGTAKSLTAVDGTIHIFRARGCSNCRGTGYVGRTTISETLLVDDGLRTAIGRRLDVGRFAEQARAGGMQSLASSGFQKIVAGETTVDEVVRVTRL